MSNRVMTIMVFLLTALGAWSQDMKVRSLTVAQGDLTAKIDTILDRNGTPCGLVKVQLPLPGATFDQTGMVIGNVDYKSGEYWVYMNDGAYMLEIRHPNFHPLFINFNDYGITVQKLVTYKLVIDVPTTDIPTQKFIIDYSPANAIVIVDSKSYQGNGHIELTLPIGTHDYQIAAVGYGTAEGSIKLNALSPRKITETLQRNEEPAVLSAPITPTVQASSPPPAAITDTGNSAVETFTVDGVSFNMVRVEGGTFKMGSKDRDADDDEKPVHQVTLSSYAIGETEVTQELWQAVMGSNPSHFKGTNLPVEQVSWEDCQEFIRQLNAKTGRSFRLPTEAEWEFAARGGNKSQGYKYSGSNNVEDVAWYRENSDTTTHPVKTKQANELGLYDMSGNVWEWCQDWHESYSHSMQTNPTGSIIKTYRVYRGGSWSFIRSGCRSTRRNVFTNGSGSSDDGLRLAL